MEVLLSAGRSVQDAEVDPPGPHLVDVAERHRLLGLAEVVQVVDRPRGEQLTHRDLAERGVEPAAVKGVRIGQQWSDSTEIPFTQDREPV
jgi:hypothetical protein